MSDLVTLTIDDQEISVPEGTTILEAAKQLGIEIPVICFHSHLTANGVCRICSVDIGWRVQAAACVTTCSDGMEVKTSSQGVVRARKTILELLSSSVDLDEAPEIRMMMEKIGANGDRYSGGKRRRLPVYDDNPFYVRDYNQCINCWRCVQVCADDGQFAYALSFDGRGFETTIGTFMGKSMPDTTCVFCGQCVGVCPTGALKSKRQSLLEIGLNPNQVMAQTRRGKRKKRE